MTDAVVDRGAGPGTFVGRDVELGLLLGALEQARKGRGGLVLIGGEPGIGKSRLADELAGRAREAGADVLWGRCWEGGGAPAYWPWVQCLRAYLRSHDQTTVARHIGDGAPFIAQIVPEIEALAPAASAATALEPDAARFRLFDATANFLRRAAGDTPLVIVIDDLQAADTPSLLLLRFVASQLADARILLLATYRDVLLAPDHPLTSAITEMTRETTTTDLRLRGLSVRDIGVLAERGSGVSASPELVAELHRQTNGNPLFVREAMNLLAAEGRLAATTSATIRFAIPGAVRDVITRRLEHLSEACRTMLSLASILGPDVPTEILRRLAGTHIDELLDALHEAVRAGLLIESGPSLGRYRFSHDLVREVLHDDMSAAQRARLHVRAAEAIEELPAATPHAHLAQIAYHLSEAGPAAAADKTTDYAARAARHAARQLAHEEAVRLYGMALQALEFDEAADEEFRCGLLLELGDAQMRAGDTPRAKETFLGAAAIARRLGLSEHLARAALGYGGRFVWGRAANDRQLVPLLEDALRGLGKGDTLLRARVLARLAGALRDEPDPSERDKRSREAVALARRLGDPATLAYALDGRYSAIWAPDTADERLAIADEIVQIADGTGEGERAFQGNHYRLCVYLERGDIPAVRAQLEANARLAERLRQPAQLWYVAASVAILNLLEGRFEEAAMRAGEAFEHGQQAEYVHATGVHLLQQYAIRREQGLAGELEDSVRELVDEFSFWPWMRVALLHLYVELGRKGDARSLIEGVTDPDMSDLPWDNDWLMGMSLMADVVVGLGDSRRAGALYELLAPYWDRNGFGHPEFCTGSLSRPLGLLAAMLGDLDRAEHHFEQALEMNRRMGARPWLAHSQHDYASVLLTRRQRGDEGRATELMAEALATARELGMAALERRIGELTEPALTEQAAEQAGTAVTSGTLRREGEYWTVSYAGDSFRLRDAKGLHYLARLLGAPGREMLALELAQEGRATSPSRAISEADLRPASPADAGAQLDLEAKQAYRARLHELQAELDEAESWNDPERADRAREEMEFIARELARAVGLGGRDRSAGSASERARLAVTRAIRLAMGRIAQHSTTLGEHLETTIHTGTYCAYKPDARVPVEWRT